MRSSPRLRTRLALSFTAGVLAMTGFSAISQVAHSQPETSAPTVTVPPAKSAEKAEKDLSQAIPLDPAKLGDPLPRNLFVELSKLINPTVVSITTTAMPHRRQGGYRDPLQEFLEDFWGGRGGGRQQMAPPRQQPVTALGTGFIIRADGLIITNNHVVEEADQIKVQLDASSNKFYEATVIGRDNLTDIALIKIDAKHPLPFARLGSSKELEVGEWVAAFGNPYGHAHTMTKGIVSAIGREIAELNRFPFIQTDASINPGNSGGPLVNTQGLVIGVNTAIDARAQGIGFAIPIDNVKQVIGLLEKDGRIKHGYIGVNIAAIDENVASQLGLDDASGALISAVLRGSPADKAGILPYDIIVEVNGKKIEAPPNSSMPSKPLEIGAKAKVKVWRFDDRAHRTEKNLTMEVGENPADKKSATPKAKQYFGQKAPFDLGFKISDYSDSVAEDLGVPTDAPHNPLITEVTPNSSAAKAGFAPGDLILDINRQPTGKATDVIRNLHQGRNIIRLLRGNSDCYRHDWPLKLTSFPAHFRTLSQS